MALVLLDTNVLIDHFNGVGAATIEIANHQDLAISAITWMEVAVGLDGSDLCGRTSIQLPGLWENAVRMFPSSALEPT